MEKDLDDAGTAAARAGPMQRPPLAALCAVVAVAVAATHAGSLGAGFVSLDDGVYVYANEHVRAGLTRETAAWAFRLDESSTYYMPVTWLSLAADSSVFGADRAWGFHAVNVALHVATTVLLLLALATGTGRPWPAAAAALLFGLHPLTVEAVAWVTERKTVLSSALGMGAVLAYVWHAARPSWRRLAAVAALQLAGLLAKPGLVTLPALLLVLDFWPLQRIERWSPPGRFARLGFGRSLLEKLPLVAVSGAVLGLVLATAGAALPPAGAVPLATRIANAIASIPRYVAAAAWPVGLSVFHPFPGAIRWLPAVGGAAATVALTGFAAWTARRRPWLAAGWLWFLVALAPHLGLVQASTMWPGWADRFAYVPLMGLAAVAAFGVAELARPGAAARPVAVAGLATALVALAAGTLVQTRHWVDSLSLFRRAVEIEPRSEVMLCSLGLALADAGRHDEARAQLERALALRWKYPEAHCGLAKVSYSQHREAEAEFHFREALRAEPDDAEALFDYGQFLRAVGRAQEARPLLARFIEVAPPSYYLERVAAMEALGVPGAR